MSDELGGRTSYGSSTKKKSASTGGSKGSGKVATGGAGSGARKADSPSAWLRTPTRTDASARARSYTRK